MSILITPYGPGSERKFALVALGPKAGVVQLPSPPGLVNLTSSTNHQSQQVPEPCDSLNLNLKFEWNASFGKLNATFLGV